MHCEVDEKIDYVGSGCGLAVGLKNVCMESGCGLTVLKIADDGMGSGCGLTVLKIVDNDGTGSGCGPGQKTVGSYNVGSGCGLTVLLKTVDNDGMGSGCGFAALKCGAGSDDVGSDCDDDDGPTACDGGGGDDSGKMAIGCVVRVNDDGCDGWESGVVACYSSQIDYVEKVTLHVCFGYSQDGFCVPAYSHFVRFQHSLCEMNKNHFHSAH